MEKTKQDMTELKELYNSIEILKKHGLDVPDSLMQQMNQKENDYINKEIVPSIKVFASSMFEGLKNNVMLVVDYQVGKGLEVRVVKKNVVSEVKKTDAKKTPFIHQPQKPYVNIKRGPGTKSPATGLCVYLRDGSMIQEYSAADTFTEAIKYAGPSKVRDLNIILDHVNLVSTKPKGLYSSQFHFIENGWYVNCHSNTLTKKRFLEKISKDLGLEWKVKIIE